MAGAVEREDGPNHSRARDEEAWETHLEQQGEGRAYVLSGGAKKHIQTS